MPKQSLDTLTETMYYVLMALTDGPMCGVDVAAWVARRTAGRVQVGPATLYTILAKFEKEHYIAEVEVEGRRRTYAITGKGQAAYAAELARLRRCVADAEAAALPAEALPAEGRLLPCPAT